MKFVVGIVLVIIVIGLLIAYIIFMLNAHEMVFCGDVKNEGGGSAQVTRIYTTDLSANDVLAEIVNSINSAEGDSVALQDLTEILAQYQNIVYAPVFILEAARTDTSTYVITGSIYDGLSESGEPAEPDYLYRNMQIAVGVNDGIILAAQNVYPETQTDSSGQGVMIERSSVIEPLVNADSTAAVFAMKESYQGFRIIVTNSDENIAPKITFLYNYDVYSENPLDFTSIEDASLGIIMNVAFDEDGVFTPTFELTKAAIVTE